jgi:hypothetical protein
MADNPERELLAVVEAQVRLRQAVSRLLMEHPDTEGRLLLTRVMGDLARLRELVDAGAITCRQLEAVLPQVLDLAERDRDLQ